MGERVCDGVAERLGVEVRRGVSASLLTTYRGGGCAERVYLPCGAERAAEFAAECAARGERLFVMGGGSKTVMADGSISLPVLSTANMRRVEVAGFDEGRVLVRAEGGARVADVLAVCAEAGCGGLEFMAGVRASVGGMVRMNAGAFGEQTADHVYETEVLNPVSGEIVKKPGSETDFGYRRGERGFVLAVTFAFPVMSAEERERRRRGYIAARRARQPALPSCGSVFRNAGEVFAGELIERADMKGMRLGGAEISRVHGNFIVNTGGASAADLFGLAELAAARVRELFGVSLEKEFEILKDGLPFRANL